MKKTIIALTTALTVVTAQAQTKFGAQLGFLSSKVNIEDNGQELKGLKNKGGIKIGVFAEIGISNGIYFTPALNYVNKGAKLKETVDIAGSGTSYTTKFITNYVEIPLAFTYKANGTNGFFASAGPVIGLGIGGKLKTKVSGSINGLDDTPDAKVKFDGKKDATDDNFHLKALEIGATIAAGYELENGLRFQLSFNPNFSNLAPEDKAVYRNSYFALGVGLRF